ncbi:MAG: MoxR family ATPase [Nanoarchaeota archaeon]
MATVENVKKTFDYIFKEVGKVVIGQEEMLRQVMIAIFCDSNALLESYPGLAKTLSVKTVSQVLDLKFSRIQNTPDLMPSDITGTYLIEENDGKRTFKFQPGPIFANIVLADEINRATPKTQSALLEAMQEKQVTVGTKTFELDKPFFVLATQNPIEQEGTYPLPEAQQDRFLLKIKVDYPKTEDEIEIVNRYAEEYKDPGLKPIIKKDSIIQLQKLVRQIPVSNDLKAYAVDLVKKTREKKELIEFGASPRASIGLILSSKARALLDGRKYVSKEDINAMACPVLRHRIILNFEAERKGLDEDQVIKGLLK